MKGESKAEPEKTSETTTMWNSSSGKLKVSGYAGMAHHHFLNKITPANTIEVEFSPFQKLLHSSHPSFSLFCLGHPQHAKLSVFRNCKSFHTLLLCFRFSSKNVGQRQIETNFTFLQSCSKPACCFLLSGGCLVTLSVSSTASNFKLILFVIPALSSRFKHQTSCAQVVLQKINSKSVLLNYARKAFSFSRYEPVILLQY